MILEIKFFHKQKFRRNGRCRTEKEHKIEATTMVNIKEIPKEDLRVACKCSWLDKEGNQQERIFRHYNGRFWKEYEGVPEVYDKKEMPDYDAERYWYNEDCHVDEDLYQKSKDAGTIVLGKDNFEEMVEEVQRYAQEFICCDGKCWKAMPEPVATIGDDGRLGVYLEGKRLLGKDTYNLKDVNWNKKENCSMEMLLPEAFVYGYDEQKFCGTVQYYLEKEWPTRELSTDKVGEKLFERILPLVVQKVKGYNTPSYRFERKDVMNALDDVFDRLAAVESIPASPYHQRQDACTAKKRFLMDFVGAEPSAQINKYADEHRCTPVQIQVTGSGKRTVLTVLFETV